jgi:serine protease SohB
VELGLVDGVGHLVPVMKARYGDKVRFRTVAPRRPLFRRLGVPGIGDALDAVEALGHWKRYGLIAR